MHNLLGYTGSFHFLIVPIDALTRSASLIFTNIIFPKFGSWSLILSLLLETIHWRDLKIWSILQVLRILYSYFTVVFITLSGTALQLQHFILRNFILLSETPSKNMTFFKKSQVRVKSRSKFMPVFFILFVTSSETNFQNCKIPYIGPSFQSVIMKIGTDGEYLFQNAKTIKFL